jgi:hypothetical protein
MGKNVFLGLRQVAFSESSLLAIALAIDPIDPPLTHCLETWRFF